VFFLFRLLFLLPFSLVFSGSLAVFSGWVVVFLGCLAVFSGSVGCFFCETSGFFSVFVSCGFLACFFFRFFLCRLVFLLMHLLVFSGWSVVFSCCGCCFFCHYSGFFFGFLSVWVCRFFFVFVFSVFACVFVVSLCVFSGCWRCFF